MVPKKKGRKPKSYYENLKLQELSNNLLVIVDNTNTNTNSELTSTSINTINETILDVSKVVVHKKRGRKPKGGIIIEQNNVEIQNEVKPNIILHLNCKLNDIITGDLNYDPTVYNIKEFDNINIQYDYIDEKQDIPINNEDCLANEIGLNNECIFNNSNASIKSANNSNNNSSNNNSNPNCSNINASVNSSNILNNTNKFFNNEEKMLNNDNFLLNNNEKNLYNKAISKKLEDLSKQLKTNNINKKSACFWCTYNFDNQTILIPKYEIKNTYFCYGNFCSPECACSYLMNENIESSQKFERYYMLNNIYGKIYNYEKNIKLAPSPYFTLEKFYGNLNIQEYRKLLKHERLLLVVDKPLSKLTPELYDENEDYILNNKSINNKQNSNKTYKINVK
jgi:hypothetical protein